MKRFLKSKALALLALILSLSILLTGCAELERLLSNLYAPETETPEAPSVTLGTIPAFNGSTPYVIINDNKPFFDDEKTDGDGYELFTPLDELGRCGTALALVSVSMMPTEERGDIGHVNPSGWQSVKYDIVSGKYLYNRSHLIGFQLTGENDNELNLITGTRYFNVEGMLPFENMVAKIVKDADIKVLYRVTPMYNGDELVARGVLMEAMSIGETPEENGEDIEFCVYVYNNQPGINIDYATGESRLSDEAPPADDGDDGNDGDAEVTYYILNTKTQRFHLPTCSGAASISDENRSESELSREELIESGYSACGTCKP